MKNNKSQLVTGVLYIPSLSTNLISASKLCEKALSVKFSNSKCYVFNGEFLVVFATRQGGIYILDNVLYDSQEHSFAANNVNTVPMPQCSLDTGSQGYTGLMLVA